MKDIAEQFIALGLYEQPVEVQDEIFCDIQRDELTVDLTESLDNPEKRDEITSNVWKDEIEADLCLSLP